MDNIEFRSSILKLNGTRKHKVSNSYGIHDCYKYYKKHRKYKYSITESLYSKIIKEYAELIIIELLKGKEVKLPSNLGSLEIRKYPTYVKFDGKLKTNLPIDWNRTIKLWEEDKQAHINKTLIRIETKEIYKVYYNRNKAKYKNKCFYQLNINRELKNKIKEKVNNGELNAYLFKNSVYE